jgi:hypothetical protein
MSLTTAEKHKYPFPLPRGVISIMLKQFDIVDRERLKCNIFCNNPTPLNW